ncbi:MAG: DNA internalization-related competence protein ComEC/Rec2 [Candidatus Lindowbacteria bacterium]|nr:DNA internalization-related competence protein ComEC/Rec2 [Candidatus Lindowbacteria bacterium]
MRRPLVWLLVSLMSGAAAASLFQPPFYPLLFAFLSAWLSANLFIILKKRRPGAICVLSATFFLGACTYLVKDFAAEIPDELALHYTSGRAVTATLTGIASQVRPTADGQRVTFMLDVETIEYDNQAGDNLFSDLPVSGRAQVSWREPSCRIEPGQRITVKGRLSPARGFKNPGVFDYERFMHRRGVFTKLFAQGPGAVTVQSKGGLNWALRLREYVRRESLEIISRSTRTPETRAFAAAMLLDERSFLTKEMNDWFRRTGTFHVISISGLHVGLVYLIVSLALTPLPLGPRTRVGVAILFVWLYAFITGASVPVIRSAIMLTLVLAEYYLARESDFLSAIALAAFAIVAFDPLVIDDISFQLSFLAVVLLCTFEPFFSNRISPLIQQKVEGIPGALLNKLALTLYASLVVGIGMSPVVAYHFNQASLVFPIANLIVIPVVSLVLASGFACLLVGFLWLKAAAALGLLIEAFSWIAFGTVRLFSMIPASSITVSSPPLWVLGLEAFAIMLMWWRGRPLRKVAVFAIVASATVLTAFVPSRFDGDGLRATFLDLGDADSCLIEFPGGHTMLVDAGFATPYLDCGESVIAPYLRKKRINTLDTLVLTHPDADHIGGAPYLIREMGIDRLALAASDDMTDAFLRILEHAKEQKLPLTRTSAGDVLWDADGVRVETLSPPPNCSYQVFSDNEASVVLRITYGETSFLLPADAEKKALRLICDSGRALGSRALKAPHHGLASGFDARFVGMVGPELIVISGEDRRARGPASRHSGSPAGGRASRYARLCKTVLSTHDCGAIVIESDGHGLTTRPTRRSHATLF